ncbi:hypothetical protein CCUG60884_01471 [Mycobacteroides salmoniphilum]|uniref:Uncharacterized protein n=1 Tax=Mycobacteroides salmoniphilum TaxID=404941 RepID=A0A4R8SVV2_9MYCO|nr:hypothetical protein CCUG60884_01471 [Mycobacteroides salmoniphilum]
MVSGLGKGAGKFTLGHALVSAALGLGTYYGMRLLGASELHALMAAAVVSAVRVIYTAVRDKRFDIVAGFIMLMHGATLVVALLTSSPQLAQLTHVVPVVLFGVFYIGSCLTKRPLTEVVIDLVRPGWVARHHWTDADLRAYHRMHVRLCVIVGTLELVQAAVMTGIVLRYSVDIAQVANGLLATVGSAARLAFVIAVIWVFLRRRGHHHASPPRQSQVSEPDGSTPELIGSTCTPSSSDGATPSAVITGVVPSQGTQPRA